jgi:hypothetical protein
LLWSLLHMLGGHSIAAVERIQGSELVPLFKIGNKHRLL